MQGLLNTSSFIRLLGVGVLVLGLSGPALAAPKENNPGQPFGEILEAIANLQMTVDNLQGDVDNLPGALGPCEVPPVWGQTYDTDKRFVSVLGGAAFCDKATGLVWDGSPVTTSQASWQGAISHCTTRTVGGQHGFHLPMIEQLTSLLPLLADDLNSATGDGPFTGVQTALYWSASTSASNPAVAWNVHFSNGNVNDTAKTFGGFTLAWCVRGGQAYDGQDVQEVIDALP